MMYEKLVVQPEDPILGIPPLFRADTRPFKVNLGIGAYQDEHGVPVVFDAVRQAEEFLLTQKLDKEYLPISGDAAFCEAVARLIFGEKALCIEEKRLVTLQTIGASGALRLGGELLKECGVSKIYLPETTWSNHRALLSRAGLQLESYPYYDLSTHSILFDRLCEAISEIKEQSAVLFQASCHNPAGCDLTEEQWRVLSEIFKANRQIIPFFDIAYQGLGRGLDEDAYGVRLFAKEHAPLVTASFAKNFGLYGERMGILSVVLPEADQFQAVLSNLKQLVRGNYSTPPLQGARIIKTILNTPELYQVWVNQLTSIRQRLQTMRDALFSQLSQGCATKDFSFIQRDKGFFSLTGLTKEQVLWLRKEKAIYLLESGRMNVAGLNHDTIAWVVSGILEAFQK